MQRQLTHPVRFENGKAVEYRVHRWPDQPMGVHGPMTGGTGALSGPVSSRRHDLGERMHKARHTAGQRLLDATGNLKAVQKLLGHASIQTTGDIYTDWDVEQLAESLPRSRRCKPEIPIANHSRLPIGKGLQMAI